jgi:VWFA-related protein
MRHPFPLLLASLLAVAPLGAQEPGPTTFLDQVVVRVIDVDVVVLDADGNPVKGLGRDDFQLLEDGKPVEISNFLAYEEQAPAFTVVTPATPEGETPAVATPAVAAAPTVTWVVYLDQARLDPGPRNDVLKQIRTFLGQAPRQGDRFLVAYFDGNALRVGSSLTTDAAQADAAVEGLQKQRGNVSNLESRRSFLRQQIAAVDTTPGGVGRGFSSAPDEAAQLLDDIDAFADQEVLAGRFEVTAARDLLAVLSGGEGRVAILYAGAGIETRPAESLYEMWRNKFTELLGRNEVESRTRRNLDPRWTEVQKEYSKLLQAANGGRFTLFTIQAGRNRGPDVSAETPGDYGFQNQVGGDVTGLREGSSLAALAEETGGRTFVASSKLADRLQAVRRDMVTYYSLGYHPEGDKPGRRRQLDVKVRRPGLKVLHRSEVSDRSWEEQATDATVTALLAESEPENPFGISVETAAPDPQQKRRGGSTMMPVVVKVPLRQVALVPEGQQHKGELLFEFALRDPDGGFRRLESRPLSFQVPNEKLSQALGQYVSFRVELAFAPGAYKLATTVLDQLAGTRSTAILPIEVAKP